MTGQEHSATLADFVERHGNQLLRTARRYCDSATDAEDVYQSAIEVLLSKAPDGYDDDRLLAWALTVTRNEALMEHRRRARQSGVAFDEIAQRLIDPTLEAGERIVRDEELGQAREALERITPSQLRCLLLRADGLSYPEIEEVTGFSYAKVNRCLSEGRKAFRGRIDRIESGAECKRIAPLLSVVADAAAGPGVTADVELHLKTCLVCRATLREYCAVPQRAAVALPLGIALGSEELSRGASLAQRAGEAAESAYANLQERLFGHAATIHQGGEIAAAKKAVAVLAATATLVGGGAALHEVSKGGEEGGKRSAPNVAPAQRPAAAATGVSGTQLDRVQKRVRDRRARAASAADVRRATRGTTTSVAPAGAADFGNSAGDDGTFDPRPPATDASRGGASDPDSGLAP